MCRSMFTISPVNLTCTNSSISAWMKAPGTSRTATARFSKASIIAVRNTASVLTVGAVASSLAMYALCFQPSAHPRPFTLPHRFRLRNMRYASASFRCSNVKLSLCTGITTPQSCNWRISFSTAFTPSFPKVRRPAFSDICGVSKTSLVPCVVNATLSIMKSSPAY